MNTGSRKHLQEKPIVLVVDRDMGSRFRTSVHLMRLEYHVFSVETAEDALTIMGLTTPCMVITDLSLTQMNGIELLKRVKRDPRTRRVPVLIYTAIESDSYRNICEQAGCAAYLVQTEDCNELYETIQKATEPTPRHFVRLSTWLDVVFAAPGGEQAALVTAISEQGMFVNTTQPLPYASNAEFTVYLPKLAKGGVKVTGKVLYSHTGGAGKSPGMGIKFLRLRPEDGQLIKTFIRERLSEGLAMASGL